MWLKWPQKDRLHFNNMQERYHRKANLATMSYSPGKNGSISDLYYREFHKNILPNLSYIKLDCSLPSSFINTHMNNIGIWLQKEGQTDYRSRVNIESGDFLKFPISDTIFKKVREFSLQARNANDKIDVVNRESKFN